MPDDTAEVTLARSLCPTLLGPTVTSSRARARHCFRREAVNKAQLIETLAASFEGNKKDAARALDAVVDTITRSVAKGEKVAITGFGAFEKVERAARTARNPMTGAKVKVKKTSVPKFRPGATLKSVVADPRLLPKTTASAARAVAGTARRGASTATGAARTAAKAATTVRTAAKPAPARSTGTRAAATAAPTTTRASSPRPAGARSTSAAKPAAKPGVAKPAVKAPVRTVAKAPAAPVAKPAVKAPVRTVAKTPAAPVAKAPTRATARRSAKS
ncbi:MAG: HU family DNA-binding protein [Actinomycetes bacterium]